MNLTVRISKYIKINILYNFLYTKYIKIKEMIFFFEYLSENNIPKYHHTFKANYASIYYYVKR